MLSPAFQLVSRSFGSLLEAHLCKLIQYDLFGALAENLIKSQRVLGNKILFIEFTNCCRLTKVLADHF